MRIEVTAEDIAGAEPGNGERCPITRALQRITGRSGWFVDLQLAHDEERGNGYRLPEYAQVRAYHFDLTHVMRPFGFELEGYDEERDTGSAHAGSVA